MFVIDFIQWNPFVSILIVSAVLTFLLTWVYKMTINHKRYKEINERQKTLRNEMKGTKDMKKLNEIQNETMTLSMESLKLSFKPMLITFIPVLIIFGLLKQAYTTAGIGNIIPWGTNLPIIGTGAGWFLCYFVLSFVFSIIFRKILKF
jgi:uncharacterized membrane protein (DUF106 family)